VAIKKKTETDHYILNFVKEEFIKTEPPGERPLWEGIECRQEALVRGKKDFQVRSATIRRKNLEIGRRAGKKDCPKNPPRFFGPPKWGHLPIFRYSQKTQQPTPSVPWKAPGEARKVGDAKTLLTPKWLLTEVGQNGKKRQLNLTTDLR